MDYRLLYPIKIELFIVTAVRTSNVITFNELSSVKGNSPITDIRTLDKWHIYVNICTFVTAS